MGVAAAVLLLVVVVYYFSVYVPHQSRMREMVDEFNMKKKQFSDMAVKASDLNFYLEEKERLERDTEKAKRMLPDKKEIPSLLSKISEEAEKYGLEVYFFEPSPESVKEMIAEVPVSVKLKGSYHEVLSFFDSVNKIPRIVNVSNIKMKSEPQKARKTASKVKGSAFSAFQPNKTRLDVSLKVTTYRVLSQSEIEKRKKGGKRGKK